MKHCTFPLGSIKNANKTHVPSDALRIIGASPHDETLSVDNVNVLAIGTDEDGCSGPKLRV